MFFFFSIFAWSELFFENNATNNHLLCMLSVLLRSAVWKQNTPKYTCRVFLTNSVEFPGYLGLKETFFPDFSKIQKLNDVNTYYIPNSHFLSKEKKVFAISDIYQHKCMYQLGVSDSIKSSLACVFPTYLSTQPPINTVGCLLLSHSVMQSWLNATLPTCVHPNPAQWTTKTSWF